MSTERTRTRVTPGSDASTSSSSSVTSVLRGNTVPSASVTSSARHRPSSRVSSRRRCSRVVEHVLDPDAAQAAAVVLADDELLRDVDETPGQVPGVGGAQRGVGETLAGTVRRDEVLEHGQALTEVALDRPRDDLAARVGHQTTHAGDLADLHDVATGARAHHHLDGVELLALSSTCIASRHLVGGVGPDLDLLLAPLVVGDDAAVVLLLDLVRLGLELLEERRLARRRADVGDRDRQTGTGRVLEAELLQVVEARRPPRPS